MSKRSDERRAYARRRVTIPIKIKLESYDDFIEQYITDISAGGLFIATPNPYEPGDIVDIEFYLKDNPEHFFKVRGTVQRINHSPHGMGIHFTEIEEESQKLLDELLTKTDPDRTEPN